MGWLIFIGFIIEAVILLKGFDRVARPHIDSTVKRNKKEDYKIK